MLANIYMNRFLNWRLTKRGDAFRAHVVAYADDFVILSRGRAAEAVTWTKAVMTKLGLTLNEAKTSLKDARQERFDFLGYANCIAAPISLRSEGFGGLSPVTWAADSRSWLALSLAVFQSQIPWWCYVLAGGNPV
jgi:hypothetical protein